MAEKRKKNKKKKRKKLKKMKRKGTVKIWQSEDIRKRENVMNSIREYLLKNERVKRDKKKIKKIEER